MADTLLPNNDLLKEEYFFLQKAYEDFDSKAITIKTWSVSGSLVLIGAGLSGKGSKELFLVGACASLFFWLIEAFWKGFQLSFHDRIHDIEVYFRNPGDSSISPLQISTAWTHSWKTKNKRKVWGKLLWLTVMLPHLILVLGGILLYYLAYQNILNLPKCN